MWTKCQNRPNEKEKFPATCSLLSMSNSVSVATAFRPNRQLCEKSAIGVCTAMVSLSTSSEYAKKDNSRGSNGQHHRCRRHRWRWWHIYTQRRHFCNAIRIHLTIDVCICDPRLSKAAAATLALSYTHIQHRFPVRFLCYCLTQSNIMCI